MVQGSSLTRIDPAQHGRVRTGAAFLGALDGAAYTIPLSLGSVAMIFSKIGEGFAAHAIVTTLLALAVIQLVTAGGGRPVLYSARFFEATTLAAMLDRLIPHLAQWHLPDTPAVRMALLCLLVAGAAVFVALLYAVRADRYSRHIPAPVFAGFSNSIAIALLLSQAHTLTALWRDPSVSASGTLAIAGLALATALLARRWLPRWPAAACALAGGLLAGIAFTTAGESVPMLGSGGIAWAPPAALADFHALAAADAAWWPMITSLAADAAILGTMMFINSAFASQAMSHVDERPAEGLGRLLASAACIGTAGALGAAPLSGSVQSSAAAARIVPLSAATLRFSALMLTMVAASGVLARVPLAAVVGALVCEAVFMVDRPSLQLAKQWITRRAMSRHAREDLALIAAVTATAVLLNMVAAVIAGLLLGLVLFASRQLAPPVRAVSDGTQMSSNCARSRSDVQALGTHGAALRVVELEGDLFFGNMDTLNRSLREALHGAGVMVIDWTDVRHVDSSVAQTISKFQRAARARGVPLMHVEPLRSNPDAASVLAPVLSIDRVAPDLDRALEAAENLLLQSRQRQSDLGATSTLEAISLFKGMHERERTLLDSLLVQRRFARGDTVVSAGEASDELMVVLHGSASVLVPGDNGQAVRVAGLRHGAVIGEMAFLDRARRSATVVAEEEMLVATLDRGNFDRLSQDEPLLVQKLLANIALYLATRLRHTTQLASSRNRRSRA